MKNKLFLFFTALIIMSTILTACQKLRRPISKTGVYFDTVISITLYENNSSELIDECFNLADRYEGLFSKTIPESDVYKINNTKGWVKVNQETFDLISSTFKYEDASEGRFSVVCGALVDLWDIPGRSAYLSEQTGNSESSDASSGTSYSDTSKFQNAFLPTKSEISEAIMLCGKDRLDMDSSSCSIRINTKGAKVDLGAVAKGYVADKMKEYLLARGVKSGIIQLGGNVLTIGSNPLKDNTPYSIGITKPFSDNSEVITAVSVTDESVVTSGNYQRYFEYDGKIYHHIIDLTTGYPADSGLNSVSVICPSSTEADIMSTILFLEGKEKGANLISSFNLSNAVFIDNNNQLMN